MWQQIRQLDGFTTFCFEKDEYLAATKWDGLYHTWYLLRREEDGTVLQIASGFWASMGENPDVRRGLGLADEQILKAKADGR